MTGPRTSSKRRDAAGHLRARRSGDHSYESNARLPLRLRAPRAGSFLLGHAALLSSRREGGWRLIHSFRMLVMMAHCGHPPSAGVASTKPARVTTRLRALRLPGGIFSPDHRAAQSSLRRGSTAQLTGSVSCFRTSTDRCIERHGDNHHQLLPAFHGGTRPA